MSPSGGKSQTNQPTVVPPTSADAMAQAIRKASCVLNENRLLVGNSFNSLSNEARRIGSLGDAAAWEITVDRNGPVKFIPITTETGQTVQVQILTSLVVDQNIADQPPFKRQDIAIEIMNEVGSPIGRWHFDRANTHGQRIQEGPLFHLQFGGHNSGQRDLDYKLKVPRLAHPPMDLVLACELVVANFFSSVWAEFRLARSWCEAISVSQRLCYPVYLQKMSSGLFTSSSSILQTMWARNWANQTSPT